MNAADTEEALVRELQQSLAELPGWSAQSNRARSSQADGGFDARLRIDKPVPAEMLIEVKSSAFPRDIRATLWQLRKHMDALPATKRPRLAVIAARHLSPGSRKLLQDEGVGYYVSGGSLFLPLPGAYVLVDRPPTGASTPERSLFTERRATVLHALLRNPHEPFGVNSLAHDLQLAAATVSETATLLDKLEWTQAKGQGPGKRRTLTEPGALLDEWAAHVKKHVPLAFTRYFVPDSRKETLEQKIASQLASYNKGKSQFEYAITGEMAGQHYAPFLSHVPIVRCRVRRGLFFDPISDAKRVTEGANFEIIESDPSELTDIQQDDKDPRRYATPVQVYLDLVRLPGRAQELADHLRRERLRF